MAAARRFVGSEVGKVRADAEGERERRGGGRWRKEGSRSVVRV